MHEEEVEEKVVVMTKASILLTGDAYTRIPKILLNKALKAFFSVIVQLSYKRCILHSRRRKRRSRSRMWKRMRKRRTL